MRSRPRVKLLLSPPRGTPGTRLVAETVLIARTETPIDFISMYLTCQVSTNISSGKGRDAHTASLFGRRWQSERQRLTPGELRYRVAYAFR